MKSIEQLTSNYECSSKFDKSGNWILTPKDIFQKVLNYLREQRGFENNTPIGYGEMEIGKPYWIERKGPMDIVGSWEIPADSRGDDYGDYLLMQSGMKLRRFDTRWQAFRNERK